MQKNETASRYVAGVGREVNEASWRSSRRRSWMSRQVSYHPPTTTTTTTTLPKQLAREKERVYVRSGGSAYARSAHALIGVEIDIENLPIGVPAEKR